MLLAGASISVNFAGLPPGVETKLPNETFSVANGSKATVSSEVTSAGLVALAA
jgi:hypothetical protein